MAAVELDYIYQAQSGQYVVANELFSSMAPSAVFGRRGKQCLGLTWAFYGGTLSVDDTHVQVSNGTVILTASSTNYVEASRYGVVSANTVGFTPGHVALYTVVTGPSSVTVAPGYTDYRSWVNAPGNSLKAISLSDVNTTLTAAQASCEILEFTGTLTAQRNIVVPLGPQQWTIYNGTTHGLQIIGATGTGVVIATTKTAIVYSNGTNIRRVTADV